MMERVKEELHHLQDVRAKKKAARERARLEKESEAQRALQEHLERERAKLETERDRLLHLDDKALMVELILAVRGLYQQISEMETRQNETESALREIDARLDALAADVEALETEVQTGVE